MSCKYSFLPKDFTKLEIGINWKYGNRFFNDLIIILAIGILYCQM